MRLRWAFILCVAAFAISSCDGDGLVPTIDSPALNLTSEELIVADAYVVRDALEAYAADNGGLYPWSAPLPPFTPYLPGGTSLTNRYTGLANLPVFNHPQWPGEIGVTIFVDDSGASRGYRIVGRGRDSALIQLQNASAFSQETADAYDLLLANVDSMVVAVNSFYEQSGYYSADTAGDTTPSGEVLMDFLPGGQLLMNPFSMIRSEPEDGTGLAIPGAIGYLGHDTDGDGSIDGFMIEAYNLASEVMLTLTQEPFEYETVRHSFEHLTMAVAEFTSLNDGTYPRDIDTDMTPGGDTVRDLATHDHLNPYTGASAYRNGLATSHGEVGYLAVIENDVVVGYIINAMGLFDEEIERFEVTN